MGRIKTTVIKKTAFRLHEEMEGFSENFEQNKKLLKDTMPSKLVRNKIAGQLVRLVKQAKAKAR